MHPVVELEQRAAKQKRTMAATHMYCLWRVACDHATHAYIEYMRVQCPAEASVVQQADPAFSQRHVPKTIVETFVHSTCADTSTTF